MEILSHRGYWLDRAERNSEVAFRRSFDLGMGTETDLRDQYGEVVIAHDPPTARAMTFRALLDLMDGRNLRLALNIKADGLSEKIFDILMAYGHDNYFTFDMSLPEQVVQIRRGLVVYAGLSDLQKHAPLLAESKGVWLDSFNGEWFDADLVERLREEGRAVCIVSPDLHGRDPAEQWMRVKRATCLFDGDLMLCTDRPLEARAYFGV